MNKVPLGYSIRLAVIKEVKKTSVVCEFFDSIDDKQVICPHPHPYSGRGGGVFVGAEKDCIVLVAMAPHEDPFIVGFVPDRSLYFGQEGVENSPILLTSYPSLDSGEICLKSSYGSRIDLFNNGNVSIDAGLGNSYSDIELSSMAKALFFRTDNVYSFNEAGRDISGIIKRDLNEEENEEDTLSMDFLTGENYDRVLTAIGRVPDSEVQLRTAIVSRQTKRNPPLIEKRSIVYEFADSFGVRSLPFEINATNQFNKDNAQESMNSIQTKSYFRENRRTDILDLNLSNYNHLIEKVEGTVVDIYGNILDINRNVIKIPDIDQINISGNADGGLRRLYSFLRRSIKFHFEINARKDIKEGEVEPAIVGGKYNYKDYGRWFVDVDGEGLTKINIPASSNIGNIPILNRHFVSRSGDLEKRYDGQYRDAKRIDVRAIQFGPLKKINESGKYVDGNELAGQKIQNSDYVSQDFSYLSSQESVSSIIDGFTCSTAHHDIFNTAYLVFSDGKLKSPDLDGNVVGPVSEYINNQIPEIAGNSFDSESNLNANAGGRSICANLDGSLELSIGSDSVDKKSLVLDLAGGVVSHYGRDKNGRSVIHQTDGDVIIQIGGNGISDERFSDAKHSENRPGRIEIHLNRGDSKKSQKLIIDENGITIDIIGNSVFRSSGDLTISAGGKLLLNGERILMFSSDVANRDIVSGDRRIRTDDGERVFSRIGRKI